MSAFRLCDAVRLGLGVLSSVWLGGCAAEPAGLSVPVLPPGALGQVGAVVLTPALLASVEGPRAQLLPNLTRDLLLSQEPRARTPGLERAVRRGVLGREFHQVQAEESERRAPIESREWDAARSQAWLEVDRPRAVRTADAFVPVAQFTADEEAFVVAQKVHDALSAARATGTELTVENFVERARSVAAGDLEVRLIQRPALAADGRVVPLTPLDEQAEGLEAAVALGAAALTAPGDLSSVLGGRDGFHVLLCLEVIPAVHLTGDQLERRLRPVVLARRLAAELGELQAELRKKTSVTIAPEHARLTRLVWREQ